MAHLLTADGASYAVNQPLKAHCSTELVFQVVSIKVISTPKPDGSTTTRFRVEFADGKSTCVGMLPSSEVDSVNSGALKVGSIVKVKNFVPNLQGALLIIIVIGLDILHTDMELCMVVPEDGTPMPQAVPQQQVQNVPPAAVPPAAPALSYGGYDASAAPAATAAPVATGSSNWDGGYGSGGAASTFNTKPIQRDDSSQQVTPIRALNPYSNRWTLKARVTQKTEKKSWKNAKGEGTLFSIDLMDQDKTEIRATFFKEACQKFYDVIAQGSVYYFSGGKLKPVQNRQFTNIVNDYEVTFDTNSVITPAPEDGAIAVDTFNFVKISSIQNLEPQTTCDVLGLVKDVGSLSTIVSAKQGNKEIFKRDLTIVDDSATEIRLTLWGKQAQDETIGWDAKPIVAFKGCKIGDYGGRTLSLLNNGSLTVAPKIPEGAALYQWVQAQGGDASNIKASNISSGGGSGGGGKDLFENRKPVSSIKIEDMGHGEKPDWVQMKLNLLYAKADNDPWYTACTQENCKKKVVENMTGGYRCESCNIDTEGCVRRYILSTQMGDYSGSEWFSFFDEQATALLGKTADEMHNLKQLEGDDVFQAEVRKALFKQYVVKAKVKVEDVRGEMRKKCSVFSLEPVNFVTESQKMIEAIAKYQ